MNKLFTLLLSVLALPALAQTYPLVPIDSIQYILPQNLAAENDQSSYFGDTVQIEGVVTFDPCDYQLSSSGSRVGTFLQDTTDAEWSGIHVLIDNSVDDLNTLDQSIKFIDNFKVGNRVRATGIVTNFDENTQFNLIAVQSTVTQFSTMPAPAQVNINDFMQLQGGTQVQQTITGEPYEGVYVELKNAIVTDVSSSGGRIFWSVQDASGNVMRIRDISGHISNRESDDFCTQPTNTPANFPAPTQGSLLSYLKGVIVEATAGGEPYYGIAPLELSDIGPVTAAPPIVQDIQRNPTVPNSSDAVTISADIDDIDGTVTSARLFYSYGWGNTTFDSVNMSNTSGNIWAGVIPAAGADSTYVNFWIKAIDNEGLHTNYPDSLATGSFYLVLDEGINSIRDIQFTPLSGGASIWNGDTITNMNIKAVVTSSNKSWSLGNWATVQDATGPWSGIFIQADTEEDWYRGDSVHITSAVVLENFGLTTLKDVQYQILSRNNPLPMPITSLEPDSINAKSVTQAEPYEGMLLRYYNAAVVDTNPDAPAPFGEFMIDTDQDDAIGLRADDYSDDIPNGFNVNSLSPGQVLDSITGVLYYSFGNFKLLPRNLSDIAGFNTTYPNEIVTFQFKNFNPDVNGTIGQSAGTITLSVPDTADLTNLVPTIDITGISVTPGSGIANDFTTPQTYTVTAPVDSSQKTYTVTVDTFFVGIMDAQFVSALNIFPNPASEIITIEILTTQADDVQVVLYNLLGEKIKAINMRLNNGGNKFIMDIKTLPAGIYFYQIKGAKVLAAGKISISE